MFNHGKHGIHGKGLRAAVRALRGLGESLPLCGAGRAFAIGFCENARLLLSKGWKNLREEFQTLEILTSDLRSLIAATRMAAYSLALRFKPMRQTYGRPLSSDFRPLNSPREFNPTIPTVTRLNPEIVEGLKA